MKDGKKIYFFAFFFATFFFTTFFTAFFATFFLATFGMRVTPSCVLFGLGDDSAPQNASNMSGLKSILQYYPLGHKNVAARKMQKNTNLPRLNTLHPRTDKKRSPPPLTG